MHDEYFMNCSYKWDIFQSGKCFTVGLTVGWDYMINFTQLNCIYVSGAASHLGIFSCTASCETRESGFLGKQIAQEFTQNFVALQVFMRW